MPEVFRHIHRVSYSECTVGNHVYYARYLDILEIARGEMFRSIDVPFLALQQQDTIFPVVEVNIRYKAPARYDDAITVEVWLTELGKIRVSFSYRVTGQNGKVLIEGETQHVCTSLAEKPQRIADALAEKLKKFLVMAQPQGR